MCVLISNMVSSKQSFPPATSPYLQFDLLFDVHGSIYPRQVPSREDTRLLDLHGAMPAISSDFNRSLPPCYQ